MLNLPHHAMLEMQGYGRWELAISLESLADNPHTSRHDIEAARANLAALLGDVTLMPKDRILWAHPAPNAKGLVETRPLDGLRINSPFSGRGGMICTLARSAKPMIVLSVPLVAT